MSVGRLTHLHEHGVARMVDVGAKPVTERRAVALARVRMSPATTVAIMAGETPKGEALLVSRLAGIQAAKRTADLIPLCHPLPLTSVDVDVSVDVDAGVVELVAEARTVASTGVEMEAMTAASVAAWTLTTWSRDLSAGSRRSFCLRRVVGAVVRGVVTPATDARSDCQHPRRSCDARESTRR